MALEARTRTQDACVERGGVRGTVSLQERNPGSQLLQAWAEQPGVAMEPSRASAGWGGSCTQLVGVVGILAVVSAQVVAKAESGSLVTLTGLPLASRSTSTEDVVPSNREEVLFQLGVTAQLLQAAIAAVMGMTTPIGLVHRPVGATNATIAAIVIVLQCGLSGHSLNHHSKLDQVPASQGHQEAKESQGNGWFHPGGGRQVAWEPAAVGGSEQGPLISGHLPIS